MAATPAPAPTRAIFFLVDVLPSVRSSTIPSEGPSSGTAEASRAFDGTVLRHRLFRPAAPFRVLRKATPNLDQANRFRAGLGERTETQPMDRSIEKGVI